MAIVCGNDFCAKPLLGIPERSACYTEAARLCDGMRARADACFAVTGGSSAVWRYREGKTPWSEVRCVQYDQDCARLAQVFQQCRVPAVTGAAEPSGIEIADDIGHVSERSKEIVFAACAPWIRQCQECQEIAELQVIPGRCR